MEDKIKRQVLAGWRRASALNKHGVGVWKGRRTLCMGVLHSYLVNEQSKDADGAVPVITLTGGNNDAS